MAKYKVLDTFYKSGPWVDFRAAYIADRLRKDKGYICDYCGEWIEEKDSITLHHKEELTPDSYMDVTISLNPDNIMQVHAGCHNKIHKHAGSGYKRVFIVYGPPLSGKTSHVSQRSWPGDLILDMDSLYEAMSGLDRYHKPNTILNNVLGVHKLLIDNIKTRYGRWDNAWIIGGHAEKYKRERLAKDLGAELIFMDVSLEECERRLLQSDRADRADEWRDYIIKWFDNYTA